MKIIVDLYGIKIHYLYKAGAWLYLNERDKKKNGSIRFIVNHDKQDCNICPI